MHEGVLPANDRVIYRADWGGTSEAGCLRILNAARLIIREYPYRSDAEYGGSGANAFAVLDKAPVRDTPMPRESDFPGPSTPERLLDAATVVILVLFLLVLVTLAVAASLVFAGVWGMGGLMIMVVPFALAYFAFDAARKWRHRRHP